MAATWLRRWLNLTGGAGVAQTLLSVLALGRAEHVGINFASHWLAIYSSATVHSSSDSTPRIGWPPFTFRMSVLRIMQANDSASAFPRTARFRGLRMTGGSAR